MVMLLAYKLIPQRLAQNQQAEYLRVNQFFYIFHSATSMACFSKISKSDLKSVCQKGTSQKYIDPKERLVQVKYNFGLKSTLLSLAQKDMPCFFEVKSRGSVNLELEYKILTFFSLKKFVLINSICKKKKKTLYFVKIMCLVSRNAAIFSHRQ